MSSPRLDRPRHTRAHRRATKAGANQAPHCRRRAHNPRDLDLMSCRSRRRLLRRDHIVECGGVNGLTKLAQHLAIPQLARNGGETIELLELGRRR